MKQDLYFSALDSFSDLPDDPETCLRWMKPALIRQGSQLDAQIRHMAECLLKVTQSGSLEVRLTLAVSAQLR